MKSMRYLMFFVLVSVVAIGGLWFTFEPGIAGYASNPLSKQVVIAVHQSAATEVAGLVPQVRNALERGDVMYHRQTYNLGKWPPGEVASSGLVILMNKREGEVICLVAVADEARTVFEPAIREVVEVFEENGVSYEVVNYSELTLGRMSKTFFAY